MGGFSSCSFILIINSCTAFFSLATSSLFFFNYNILESFAEAFSIEGFNWTHT